MKYYLICLILLLSASLNGQSKTSLVIRNDKELKKGLPKEILYLTLMGETINDAAVSKIKKNARIDSLSICFLSISSKGFSTLLKKFPNLTSIELFKVDSTKGFAKSLKKYGRKIKSFSIRDTKTDEQFFKDLSNCKTITRLTLSGTKGLNKKILSYIYRLPKLWQFELWGITEANDDLFTEIKKSKKKYVLDISGGDFFTDKVFNSFKGSTICRLSIFKTAITDKSLDVFLSMKNLTRLKTDALSEETITKLKQKMKNLKFFNKRFGK